MKEEYSQKRTLGSIAALRNVAIDIPVVVSTNHRKVYIPRRDAVGQEDEMI